MAAKCHNSSRFTSYRPWGKEWLGENVWDLALDRARTAFDIFDHCFVAFSGGKDSTAVLEVAMKAAEEMGKLPLRVVFWDEEAIPYETEDYVRRRATDERTTMEWYCLPVHHRNACSRRHVHRT